MDWMDEATYVCACRTYLIVETEEDSWLALNLEDPETHAYFDSDETAKKWVELRHECA